MEQMNELINEGVIQVTTARAKNEFISIVSLWSFGLFIRDPDTLWPFCSGHVVLLPWVWVPVSPSVESLLTVPSTCSKPPVRTHLWVSSSRKHSQILLLKLNLAGTTQYQCFRYDETGNPFPVFAPQKHLLFKEKTSKHDGYEARLHHVLAMGL